MECRARASSLIRMDQYGMEGVTPNAIVLQFLDEHNYLDWSVQLQTYLVAKDLWDAVESNVELEHPKPEEGEDDCGFKIWRKKNATALHAIQLACGPDCFSLIRKASLAKIAWDILSAKFKPRLHFFGADHQINDANYSYHHQPFFDVVWSGDLSAVKDFLTLHPSAIRARNLVSGNTSLHVAVMAGHLHIVEELVSLMSEEEIEIQNSVGNTALSLASFSGTTRIAECMTRKSKRILGIANQLEDIPVTIAVYCRHTSMAYYLYSVTPLDVLLPDNGCYGASLLTFAIQLKYFDIALDLLRHCPELTTARDRFNKSPLVALACQPFLFLSGCHLSFLQQWIYHYAIRIQPAQTISDIYINVQNQEENKKNLSVMGLLQRLVSNFLRFLGIKNIYQMKLEHVQSLEILSRVAKQIRTSTHKQLQDGLVDTAIFEATDRGIVEFVISMIRANPSELLWSIDNRSRHLFMHAIQFRQAKIFSLLHGIDMKPIFTAHIDKSSNNMLHIAANLALPRQLTRISGAGLQMQRELQWFKEVEKIVPPKALEDINSDGLQPRELFTMNHKDLLIAGEKWMKETATSCTVVGALIVTIMFATAITVPGGNNGDTGFPIFVEEKLFKLFIVSDALSLFSSTTSVLMFLGILTSRYAEDDFLISLPTKMIIGLSTLFFSLATMMITFCASLLILFRRDSGVAFPAILLSTFPATLFLLMQFPLLREIFISTYGPSIFYKKVKYWL